LRVKANCAVLSFEIWSAGGTCRTDYVYVGRILPEAWTDDSNSARAPDSRFDTPITWIREVVASNVPFITGTRLRLGYHTSRPWSISAEEPGVLTEVPTCGFEIRL
jgi:hypothetical protein